MNSLFIKINIVSYIISILITLKAVHIMQLNSYNIDQQIIWYKKNVKNFIPNIILLTLTIIFFISLKSSEISLSLVGEQSTIRSFPFMIYMATFILIPICGLVILIENLPRKEKKKLIFTNRVIRLISANVLVFSILLIISILNLTGNKPTNQILISLGYLSLVFAPIINFIVFLLMTPVENGIRNKFKNESKEKLMSHTNLYKIAITGSYGKTSVKHFLKDMLMEKYSVTMTPGSYNTPMGIALTINNDLKSTDEIFITEFGARRIGDIDELSNFVDPDSCIISEIGNQHLDTFINVENVLNTKFEVVDYILKKPNKDNSFILVNGDNVLIKNKIKNYKKENKLNGHAIYTFGEKDENDFSISDIKTINENNEFITSFIIKVKNGILNKEIYNAENQFIFSTRLIGKHNIINLTASIAMSLLLNVDVKDISFVLKRIEQVEHRLEIKRISNEIVLIDDAYNSNPKGAKNAVLLMNDFNDMIKIIITPGMVELGKNQFEENKAFGKEIAENLDYAFIVGNTNKDAIMKGLNSKNSILKDKYYYDTFNEAFENAVKISGNKLILIENDLPDNY